MQRDHLQAQMTNRGEGRNQTRRLNLPSCHTPAGASLTDQEDATIT